MKKKDRIYAMQRMGYSSEMIAGELGCDVGTVLYRMHTPIDYGERNRVRKMYSGGKSTIEIHRTTGLPYAIIANHLRSNKKIYERKDMVTGVKEYFYTFRHLRKYMPSLTLVKCRRVINLELEYEGYRIRKFKPKMINYDFAD